MLYKFTCASSSFSYIGRTYCHFKTRIEDDIEKDNKSHFFKHLHSTATCFDSYYYLCFKIINKANSKFDLKMKEPLHTNWRILNAQQNHLAVTRFSCVVFCNSFSSIVFIFLNLIIGTFYFLNYTLLLLHLFITQLVIDFIIFM